MLLRKPEGASWGALLSPWGLDRAGHGFRRDVLFAPLTTQCRDGNHQHHDADVHEGQGPDAMAIELTILVAGEPERRANQRSRRISAPEFPRCRDHGRPFLLTVEND